jgi:hypothetical protein
VDLGDVVRLGAAHQLVKNAHGACASKARSMVLWCRVMPIPDVREDC